jgi:peptidoglycan-associated lipoprotein
MAACSKKAPTPTTTPTAPPTRETPPPPTGPVSTGVVPGSVQDFVINAGDRVYFDFDSYSVRADAGPVLDAQAAWLGRYPAVQIRIEGNADERGTREYNLALGARRANAVRDYLVSHGVSASRISTVSYGKEQPIDGGTSEESYQRNRNAHTALTAGAR